METRRRSALPYMAPAVACLLLALTGCTKPSKAEARSKEAVVKTVKIASVQRESMRRDVEVVGTLTALDEVVISAQSEGVVEKVLADLGDMVKEGQPLIELDSEKLRYNLDQQKASLSRALTKYGATSVDALPAEKDTPDVRKAAAELLQARQARDRAEALFKEQLIARQAMDDAEGAYQSKQASYDSALQNASNLKADIDVSAAVTRLAARQLRDSSIRAPFDAYVQKRMVTQGQLVSPQAPVMSLVRGGALKIVAEIPERMAPWIKLNQSAQFTVDAFADRRFNATIARISPSVNTQTRSFSFEALAPNEQMLLKPGSFARVQVQTSLVEPALTVPFAAIQFRFGVARAFVVDSGNLSAREVKLGDRHDERIEVVNGLKQGEKIAISDLDNLAEGMNVASQEPEE